MAWVLHSGSALREMLEPYGQWQTVYDRFVRSRHDGTFDQIANKFKERWHGECLIEWYVDRISVRAAKPTAVARCVSKNGPDPVRETMAWAAHAAVGEPVTNARGTPLSTTVHVEPGMTSPEVVSLLIDAFKIRGVPKHIRSNNGGELIARTTGTPPSAHIAARENRGTAERCCASVRVATSGLLAP